MKQILLHTGSEYMLNAHYRRLSQRKVFARAFRIEARPTTDVAREALFNILEGELNLSKIEVLDLFSGTGAVSLEFLSRGHAMLPRWI